MSDPIIDFCDLWKRFLAGDLGSAPQLQDFWDTHPVLQHDSELAAELLDYDLQFHQDCRWKISEERYAKFLEVLNPADRNAFLARLRDPGPTLEYSPATEASTRLKDGEIIGDGRYQIERHLSSGGQAHLYLAKAHDGAKYVLKVPRRPGDEKALEYEIGYLLDLEGNPGVIRGHQRERDPQVGGFLVFPYYDKGALANRKFAGAAKELVDLLLPVIDGVGHLHRHGRVHRDLKPDNFLVNQHGRWFLADFGLVFEPKSSTLWEAKGVGTPGYCAPEQARTLTFSSEPVGPPADVFSLGVILYRLLTGRFPWVSIEPSLILPNLAPQTFRTEDNVPVDLQRIIYRCLALLPAERYPSATELAADLRKAFRISLPPQRQIRDLYENRDFVGRTYVLNAVNLFLQTHKQGVIAIQAEAGRGKTALAYYLARNIGQETIVFAYRRREKDVESPRDFLQYVAEQLHEPHDPPIPDELTEDAFRAILKQSALRLQPGKKLLLIVDGLDEADILPMSSTAPALTAWSVLPRNLPDGVYLVLTSRPRPIQGQFSEVPFRLLDLRVEYADEQRTDCKAFALDKLKLTQLGTEVSRRAVELSSENFLLLETFCKALRVTAYKDVKDVQALLERIATRSTPESRLFLLFESALESFEHELNSEQLKECVRRLMRLMAFASSPLPLAIVSTLQGPQTADWEGLERAGLSDYLHRDAAEIRPMHDAFRVFLRERLKTDSTPTHRQLAEFCLQWRTLPDAQRTYAVRNLPMHLAEAGDFERLHETLTTLEFLETKNEAGYIYELARDYNLAAKLPPQPEYDIPRRRLQLLGEALRRDTQFIHRHRADYPQALFQCLWSLCWWYDAPEAGQHYVDNKTPGSHDRVRLHELLEKWKDQREYRTPDLHWIRSLRPPREHIGGVSGQILKAHSQPITCLVASHKSGVFAAGSADCTVSVWSVAGDLIESFSTHAHEIGCIAISPDGCLLAVASQGLITIHDLNGHSERRVTIAEDMQPRCIAFSTDSSLLACGLGSEITDTSSNHGEYRGTLLIYDTETLRMYHKVTYSLSLYSIGFINNNEILIAFEIGACIWKKCDAGATEVWLDCHCICGRISPDNCYIYDAKHIFHVPSDRLLANYESFCFADGAALSRNAQILGHIWDNGTSVFFRNEVRPDIFVPHDDASCLLLDFDGLLISGHEDAAIRIRSLSHVNTQVSRLGCSFSSFDISNISFDSNRSALLVSSSTKYVQGDLDGNNESVHAPWAEDLRSYHDHAIVKCDFLTFERMCVFRGHDTRVSMFSVSPNGRCLASASDGDFDVLLRSMDPLNTTTKRLIGHEGRILAIDWSADCQSIATCSVDQKIIIWNVATGMPSAVLDRHLYPVTCVVFIDDNRIAIASADGGVSVWEISSASIVQSLNTNGRVKAISRIHMCDKIGIQLCTPNVSVTCNEVWDVGASECERAWLGECDINEAVAAITIGSLFLRGRNGEAQVICASDDRIVGYASINPRMVFACCDNQWLIIDGWPPMVMSLTCMKARTPPLL